MLTARDPEGLARERFDLIVVGGGAYGIMMALEAVRRRLRPLLVERRDFASATSHNSLRIVHGGLRYLQTLDLHRFRESVAERRWFLRQFPDLVRPLPCLLPLHGEGLRRPWPMRAALALNDALSPRRNAGVRDGCALPPGRVLGAAETRARVPGAAPRGLQGGALWYDAFIPNAPRLLIEALHWACAHGACVLNYVKARGLLETDGRVAGVAAVDALGGAELAFRAPVVVNAAGPWAPDFAAACGAGTSDLFQPSLAWNVVFDRAPPSECALAVKPPGAGAQTYFLVPWKGVLLAGTGHGPWTAGPDDPRLPAARLRAFIADLNAALPGLELGERDVARVFAGLLPATRANSAQLTVREVILDHGARGGPAGLYSLSGIKLTTSRRVADKLLARTFPAARPLPYGRFRPAADREAHPDYAYAWMPPAGERGWREPLRRALAEEAVCHLDDLLLRRSSLGDNPARAAALAPEACKLFAWEGQRAQRETEGLRRTLGLPAGGPGAARGAKRRTASRAAPRGR